MRNNISLLYSVLLKSYGEQGWWPVGGEYHRGDYSFPRTEGEGWEIVLGAVLTQNTAWRNVRSVLSALSGAGLVDLDKLLRARADRLAALIRPCGYYNQKAKKIKRIAAFFRDRGLAVPPARADLLSVWGVGPETADSILLYAFHFPVFVVDAYTRRLLLRLGWIGDKAGYDEIQSIFRGGLKEDFRIYNEYHALIVTHAKEHCRKNPVCAGCPVKQAFKTCGPERAG